MYSPLRRRVEFSRVHAQGQRRGDARLQVRVLRRPAAASPVATPVRLGMIVSKKFGSAVERNRFKRLVRAALCDLGPQLSPGWDVLVLPREAHGLKMAEVRDSLRTLLESLGVLNIAEDGEEAG